MDILQYLLDNHDQSFYLIGGISLLIELTITGLSGPLLFFGLAAFITGALSSFSVISGWEAEIFTLGVISILIAALAWKPLKAFQNSGGGADSSSDMIGLDVPVAADISYDAGKIRYSGIDWNARLDKSLPEETIKAKQVCTIVGVNGTVMLVKPRQ